MRHRFPTGSIGKSLVRAWLLWLVARSADRAARNAAARLPDGVTQTLITVRPPAPSRAAKSSSCVITGNVREAAMAAIHRSLIRIGGQLG